MLQYIINLPFKWFYILKYSVFIFCSPLKIVPNKAAAELIAHLQATQFQKKNWLSERFNNSLVTTSACFVSEWILAFELICLSEWFNDSLI